MTSFSNKHASVKETDCNNESNHQHSCEACTSNQPRPPVARRIRTVELSCLKRKPDRYCYHLFALFFPLILFSHL